MSFSGSACIRSTYSCLRTFFLIRQIRISRACLRIATWLQVCNYINSEPKASQQTLPEEKAQNVWDLCLYLCTQESLYISLHKSTYVCTIHVLIFLFLFRCIHTYIHIYVDITSDTPKRQRIKYWSPPVQCGLSLGVKGVSTREREAPCALVWPQPRPIPPLLEGALATTGAPRGASRAGTGGSSGMGAGPDWDGDQGGCDTFIASRVPSDAAGIPCCSSAFPGKEGLGERRRGLLPPIKFYTSLYCFSGCFQTHKIQEIYSQMFPCLFVDSV